ncbi:hypothetical protein HDU98_003809, partial [Podochytrium sp. JEL0797]
AINDTILQRTELPPPDLLKAFDRWLNISIAMLFDQGNFEYWGQRDTEAETVAEIVQQELKPQEMRDCLKKYNAAMAIEDIPLTCSSCGCHRHGDVTSFFNLADLSMFKLTPFQLDRYCAVPNKFKPALGVYTHHAQYYNLHPQTAIASALDEVSTFGVLGDIGRALAILNLDAILDHESFALARIVTHQLLYKIAPRKSNESIALTGHVISTPITSNLFKTMDSRQNISF